jgi:hypothetical protein
MRVIVFALILLPGPGLAAGPPQQAAAKFHPTKPCRTALQLAKRSREPVKPHALREEPLATEYSGVLHRLNGCDVPIKIREDVGRVQR